MKNHILKNCTEKFFLNIRFIWNFENTWKIRKLFYKVWITYNDDFSFYLTDIYLLDKGEKSF